MIKSKTLYWLLPKYIKEQYTLDLFTNIYNRQNPILFSKSNMRKLKKGKIIKVKNKEYHLGKPKMEYELKALPKYFKQNIEIREIIRYTL